MFLLKSSIKLLYVKEENKIMKNKMNLKKLVYICEVFDTNAIIVPIKTAFYLSF